MQAGAQLHLIIAELGGAAEAMAGSDKNLSSREGALRLHRALQTYGEFFEHSGWRAP